MKIKNLSKLLTIGVLLNSISFNSFAGVLSGDSRYETFDDGNITVEDILDINKTDVKIEGNTLVNILDYSLMSSLSSTPNSMGVSINDREITRDYDITSGIEGSWCNNKIIIKNGMTYTFVADVINNTVSDDVEVFPFMWNYSEWRKGTEFVKSGYTGKIIVSFKARMDAYLYLLHENIDRDLTGSITISNLMLLKGDYYDDFTSGRCKIPSYFEGVKSVGEDEGYIDVFSSNSITENSSYIKGYGLNSGDNSLYKNNERNVLDYTKVKPNTTYKTNHKAVYVLNFFDKDKNYLGFINSATRFTTPENCYYITASINTNYGDKVSIVESKEEFKESNFRINLDEPLRSLPNGVKDRIIKKDGKWVIERNIGSIILDGNYNISMQAEHSRFMLDNINNLYYFNYRNPVVSNNFYTHDFLGEEESGVNGDEYLVHYDELIFTRFGNIYMYKNMSSEEEFKSWLNDNPQTLLYQLKTPVYKPININPSVKLYEGVTHISNNSNIPVNMKITVDRVLNRAVEYTELAKSNPTVENVSRARMWTNLLDDSIKKDELQSEINDIANIDDLQMELKTASANLDVYIKCENMLSMSLDTNQISFDDFSGIEDIEKINAVNVSINSSLPYQLNAYLPSEIQNADKTKTLDKSILNIKESNESTYQAFSNTTDKVVLKDNCNSGNQLVHGIDIMLKGGVAHEKDVYKAVIKLEAEQK